MLTHIFEKLVKIESDQKEITREIKSVAFAVKHMTDALPPTIGIMTPSEDCKTENNPKYRALMSALHLPEVNDVIKLAETIEPYPTVNEFRFVWANKKESDSYGPFQLFLKTEF